MKDHPLQRIALFGRADIRFFMLDVARDLKRRNGSVIHLYCSGPQAVQFYRDLDKEGLFASINDGTTLLESVFAEGLREDEVFARAAAMERRLGYGYNRLAVSNRHMGRGFLLGGFYHPRSRYSEETDYVQMVHGYNEELHYWDREFAEKKITCAINVPPNAAAIARVRGIPYRGLCSSRFKNYFYWAHNEYYESPELEAAYRAGAGSDQGGIETPYYVHQVNRDRFKKATGLPVTLKKVGMTIARYAYWKLRGYRKAQGYYLWDRVRHDWRVRADYRKLNRSVRPLSDLDGKPFVFYPLHIEPEYSVQGLSPEYFFQQTLITTVARDLPVGVRLAVKEAFGSIGRRPDNFYEHIASFKNVVLLDTLELGLECVNRAAVVVTITGTAGFEAAVSGKPVITFGQHNIYNCLPHVHVVRSEGEVAGALRKALDPDFDRAAAQRHGQRFLDAVVSKSFDLRKYDFIDTKSFDRESVGEAVELLETSFAEQENQVAMAVGS
jgi:hypothetical protein